MWTGGYRENFAKYMNMLFPDRKLLLFDTFDSFDREQIDLDSNNDEQTNMMESTEQWKNFLWVKQDIFH